MSRNVCDHDDSAGGVDQGDLARYLKEGAELLEGESFGWASDDRRPPSERHNFDTVYWQLGGDWHRAANVNIIVPKPGVRPSVAVNAIFEDPQLWSFDCSQFVQVVTFYAWLKVLGPGKFDQRVGGCGGIAIKPFEGATFSRPRKVYTRTWGSEFMKDKLDKGPQPKLKWRDVVDSAPIGSRVMFRNSDPRARGTAFRNENAIKVGKRMYAAFGLDENNNVLAEEQVILYLYQATPGEDSSPLAKARRHVWIKEVDYFIDRDLYLRSLRRRAIRALRPLHRIRP